MPIPLNQERVYFLLEAVAEANGRTEENIVDQYVVKFDTTRTMAETAIIREIRLGRIAIEGAEENSPIPIIGLAITESGRWWIISKDNPAFARILLLRKDVLDQVKAKRFQVSFLEALDDEIRRILNLGLEKALAPPDSP